MALERVVRDPEIGALLRAGLVEARRCREADRAALDALIDSAVASLREAHAGLTAGQIERLQAGRELYRSFGVDPTRHRPSPEALIRRLLKGNEFPRINPPVDLANLWAVESGLPVGLYDQEKIAEGAIVLRRGRNEESYDGIRKPRISLAGRPVIADAEGPFGNPSADSLRTCVAPESSELLFVLFAPSSVPLTTLDGWCAWLRVRVESILGAEVRTALLG